MSDSEPIQAIQTAFYKVSASMTTEQQLSSALAWYAQLKNDYARPGHYMEIVGSSLNVIDLNKNLRGAPTGVNIYFSHTAGVYVPKDPAAKIADFRKDLDARISKELKTEENSVSVLEFDLKSILDASISMDKSNKYGVNLIDGKPAFYEIAFKGDEYTQESDLGKAKRDEVLGNLCLYAGKWRRFCRTYASPELDAFLRENGCKEATSEYLQDPEKSALGAVLTMLKINGSATRARLSFVPSISGDAESKTNKFQTLLKYFSVMAGQKVYDFCSFDLIKLLREQVQ